MPARLLLLALGLMLTCGAGLASAADPADDPDANPQWRQVRAALFGSRPIAVADPDVLTLDAPYRAEDAAIVPVALRSRIAQSPTRYVKTAWLVIDGNPSPVAATFRFTPDSGRADVETRVRVEQYTFVRAIAELDDGSLHMATRFVKAAGGCSAPAGKDPAAAAANLGRMRLKVDDAGEPRRAQLLVSHPNTSGLAMDQITRLYPTARYVRQVTVRYRDRPVLEADVDFSISENPSFRFLFRGEGGGNSGGELAAEVVDTDGRTFESRIPVAPRGDGA